MGKGIAEFVRTCVSHEFYLRGMSWDGEDIPGKESLTPSAERGSTAIGIRAVSLSTSSLITCSECTNALAAMFQLFSLTNFRRSRDCRCFSAAAVAVSIASEVPRTLTMGGVLEMVTSPVATNDCVWAGFRRVWRRVGVRSEGQVERQDARVTVHYAR